MGKGDIRDLLLYFAFTAVPIATFLLQDYPNAIFFTALLVVNLVGWVGFEPPHTPRGKNEYQVIASAN